DKPWKLLDPAQTMGEAIKILRTSFHAFFLSYHTFISTAALLVFPYSIATLLSQSSSSSSSPPYLLPAISSRLWLLFEASGFPSSHFFALLNVKLSQAAFSFVAALPLGATSLILAKASVFQTIHGKLPSLASLLRLYPSLVHTYLCNSFLVLAANAAVLSLLFLAFNAADVLDLASSSLTLAISVAGVILYSLVLAHALITCNMATIISAAENTGGYLCILEALVLVHGKMATAITLALPANLGAAAMEALFHCRVIRPYSESGGKLQPLAILEAVSIAYSYSLLLVFDTIITCNFVKSCKSEEKDDVHV
ncbi:unnamed protein product, partial [Musa acuminata subsp. burmannicoides]